MATFNKFNSFTLALASGVHNLSSDSLYVMLTNNQPSASNQTTSDITEISAGNGYSAGGSQAALVSINQSGGVTKLTLANAGLISASGGTIGPFRYAVLYNSTASGKPLIGWFDYGSALTLADGQQFQVQFDQTYGTLTIT
jgi:hypothetical protein